MFLKKSPLALLFCVLTVFCGALPTLFAQTNAADASSSSVLPDAPTPVLMAMASPSDAAPIPQAGPASQNSPAATGDASQHQTAQQQIKEQEKQRVLGILPAFNISYRADAVSLTRTQKMSLAFHSAVDPVTFATAFVVAGVHEAQDSDKGFGWGIEGYSKRSGAAYLDAFNGTMIGNGILPALLHQDPRYFRLGHGSVTHRLLYAMMTNVVCKHDNTHKWEPNYSNVAGNIASGAISNLYYPSDGSGIGQTFTNGMVVTAEGGLGSIFQEFWPDISRKFFHKDPTHGLDAQAQAKSKK